MPAVGAIQNAVFIAIFRMNLYLNGSDLKTIAYVFGKHADAFRINRSPGIYLGQSEFPKRFSA